MIKIISFDLQGTLSDETYSNFFWLDILPTQYAKKYNMTVDAAKLELKQKFKSWGIYSFPYYDNKYWTDMLNFDAFEELAKNQKQPKMNNIFIEYVKSITLPKIIISTTSDAFIDIELGEYKPLFAKTYSCLDYFHTAGKTPQIYIDVAKEMNVKPEEILHIGDNATMDVENARLAGVNAIHFCGNVPETISEIDSFLKKENGVQ